MERLIKMAEDKPFINWELDYIQDGECRRTFYRSDSLAKAVAWLDEITDGKAYITYCGIPDD